MPKFENSKFRLKNSPEYIIVVASSLVILILVVFFIVDKDWSLGRRNLLDLSPGSQTAKTSNVETLENAYVSNFPEFPQHPNTELVRSSSIKYTDKTEYQAVYSINRDPSEIVGWFEEVLVEEGFEVIDRGENALEAIISGNTYLLGISKANDGETYLNLEIKIDKD